jgi:hypothetical protein
MTFQRTTKRRATPDHAAHLATVEQLCRLNPERADGVDQARRVRRDGGTGQGQ